MEISLSIAGSDSSGGAGIQADLKTFQRCGVYGVCTITAVTAQRPGGVRNVFPLSPRAVSAQISAVCDAMAVASVKVGMVWSVENARAVRDAIAGRGLGRIVIDPVIAAGDGTPLVVSGKERAIARILFPLADIVTPNVAEAEALSGIPAGDPKGCAEAAGRLLEMGPRAVLITGFRAGRRVSDLYCDGRGTAIYSLPALRGDMRGTGCILSSAIAAALARGLAIREAVRFGRRYVRREIRRAWSPSEGILLARHA